MTGYEVCAAVLMVAALGPALVMAAFGRPVDRLIGVALTGAVVTVASFLLSQITSQSYDLIVPIVLVPLSVVGTLVFTRLLGGLHDGP